jgi:adenylate cyclase
MTIADYSAPAARFRSARTRIVRRLAAVVGADICGYSALMEDDEERTHREVGFELEHFRTEIEKSHGRVFSFAGDGLMAEFPSAVEALKCCLRVQVACSKRNDKRHSSRAIKLRIGLNTGELVIQQQRTGGTAVNIAARLE